MPYSPESLFILNYWSSRHVSFWVFLIQKSRKWKRFSSLKESSLQMLILKGITYVIFKVKPTWCYLVLCWRASRSGKIMSTDPFWHCTNCVLSFVFEPRSCHVSTQPQQRRVSQVHQSTKTNGFRLSTLYTCICPSTMTWQVLATVWRALSSLCQPIHDLPAKPPNHYESHRCALCSSSGHTEK